MYTIKRSRRFKKDFKRASKGREFNERVFMEVVDMLAYNTPLPKKFKEHTLQGEFKGCTECHLGFDVLLMYTVDNETKTLYLLRMGSHRDLF